MRTPLKALALIGLLSAAACGDEGGGQAQAPADEVPLTLVDEARLAIPDAQALHTVVFKRTCSPDQGVCHNTQEYPDLHTPGNLIDNVLKPCNLPEDPASYADMCEPPGDFLTLRSGPARGFSARIAHHVVEGDDWIVTLAEPVPECEAHRASFVIADGANPDDVIIEAPNAALFVPCGSTEVRVGQITSLGPELVAGLTRRVAMGDPNGNGVLGFDDGPGAQIVPGDPWRSYLLARILGTVPGTRMPLANPPLDDKEHLAFICWIETLDDDPSPDDPIDYDRCEAAAEVLETGSLELPTPMTGGN